MIELKSNNGHIDIEFTVDNLIPYTPNFVYKLYMFKELSPVLVIEKLSSKQSSNSANNYTIIYDYEIIALLEHPEDTFYNAYIESATYHFTFDIKEDGLYNIYVVTMPNGLWKSIGTLNLNVYPNCYVNSDKVLYKVTANSDNSTNFEIANIEEIISVNPKSANVFVESIQTVSVYQLELCYLNFCKELFNTRLTRCNTAIDPQLIFNRDMTWMCLNVIKYLVECEQLEEANRYLDIIHGCNGICNDAITKSKGYGCNCLHSS